MTYMYILIVIILLMAFAAVFLSKIRKIGERGSLQLGKVAIGLMESYEDLQGLTRAITFQNDNEEAENLRDRVAVFESKKMDLATQGIQKTLTDFEGAYGKAMDLKGIAKRTGDLTHYEEKLAEHVTQLQTAVRVYNKTVALYTQRKQEAPYNVIGKIIPIRPMEPMKMKMLISEEVEDEAGMGAAAEIVAAARSNAPTEEHTTEEKLKP